MARAMTIRDTTRAVGAEGAGWHCPPPFFGNQLTLSQPGGGADYALQIIMCPPPPPHPQILRPSYGPASIEFSHIKTMAI